MHVSGDAYQGDPQFVVLVDGHQIGGVQDVSAVHAAGQWQDITVSGAFSDPQHVAIEFINDAYGGTPDLDRNLYVSSITLDGHTYSAASAVDDASLYYPSTGSSVAAMLINGTTTFTVSSGATGGSGSPSGAGPQAALVASTTNGATSGSGGTTTPGSQQPQLVHDAQGHDMFVFNNLNSAGATISNFDPHNDLLDFAPLLHSVGYTGQHPFADHTLTIEASGAHSTAVILDAGTDHSTTLVTLDHVLPKNLPHSDIIWH